MRTRLVGALLLAAAVPASAADGGAEPNAVTVPVAVTVTDKGCEPSAVSVGPGRTTFRIRNASRRALEWEILNGVMVVEERENIVPGFVQSLSATLEPGEYQMTCGLLSNAKGKLIVTAAPPAATVAAAMTAAATPPAASGTAAAPVSPGASASAKPDVLDLVGPLAEYKLYVLKEVDNLVDQTRRFAEAVKANKLDEARDLYAPTRQHYERIEPIAELFDDLDKAMDVRADDFEKKDADPNFTGFHRIEKALFADRTTRNMGPLADKLVENVTDLKGRVASLTFPPSKVVGGAASLIEEVAKTKIAGEEDRYSRTDLWDFQANVDGAAKIVELFRPVLMKRDATLVAKIEKNLKDVNTVLAKYRGGDGKFQPYDKLTDRDRNAMKGRVTALAEDLSNMRGTLGLD